MPRAITWPSNCRWANRATQGRNRSQTVWIEYEGLRNNKRYAMTEGGREARYRLINLLILTKDYATAEELLERLVDSERRLMATVSDLRRSRQTLEVQAQQLVELAERDKDVLMAMVLEILNKK